MSTRWRTLSGKVHIQRQKWYAGTRDERPVNPGLEITLCGQRNNLTAVPADTEVTCRTCANSNPKDMA